MSTVNQGNDVRVANETLQVVDMAELFNDFTETSMMYSYTKKHTDQHISVNALSLAHKTIQFYATSSHKNMISLIMGDIDI